MRNDAEKMNCFCGPCIPPRAWLLHPGDMGLQPVWFFGRRAGNRFFKRPLHSCPLSCEWMVRRGVDARHVIFFAFRHGITDHSCAEECGRWPSSPFCATSAASPAPCNSRLACSHVHAPLWLCGAVSRAPHQRYLASRNRFYAHTPGGWQLRNRCTTSQSRSLQHRPPRWIGNWQPQSSSAENSKWPRRQRRKCSPRSWLKCATPPLPRSWDTLRCCTGHPRRGCTTLTYESGVDGRRARARCLVVSGSGRSARGGSPLASTTVRPSDTVPCPGVVGAERSGAPATCNSLDDVDDNSQHIKLQGLYRGAAHARCVRSPPPRRRGARRGVAALS